MDDVDAVQAQIARNMLDSGDWVTARLDGVVYLEKSPLIYWLIAISYKIFGVLDWAARIPVALSCIALAWLTAAFGMWAFGRRAGFYAGLCVVTCIGLFLFTRILIPDVMLTATIALSMWAFLRVLDDEEKRPRAVGRRDGGEPRRRAAAEEPDRAGVSRRAAFLYLLFTRQFFSRKVWQRLHLFSGLALILLIAAPWHILATLRNPPYFDFTMHSVPGEYHGFFWFYFINEQVLRFLNLRYPRDYNTVPAPLVLAVPPALAVPVERLFSGRREAVIQAGGSRRADPPAGALLDRIPPGVLHLLHHAGVLLDALLSGAGAAARLGHGGRRRLGAARHARAGGRRRTAGTRAALRF